MRTYIHAKTTDHLGRYYTKQVISKLLVSCLPKHTSGSLLDLGAGDGALSLAASSVLNKFDLITVDVDRRASKILVNRLDMEGFTGKHWHIEQDALATSLPEYIHNELQLYPSLAVCNPPFLTPKWRKHYGEIIEDAGFNSCMPAIKKAEAAILFLAQNLRLLREGGTVNIILPDSLVSASKHLNFRRELVTRYDVRRAIRLPRSSFVGTDAQAHILEITKRSPINKGIELSEFVPPHGVLSHILIDREKAAERLDYQYHISEKDQSAHLLGSVTLNLRRGNFNSAEVRAHRAFILHTTDISTDMLGEWCDFQDIPNQREELSPCPILAVEGDILIARVGRNSVDKIIGIASGTVPISDCIYRLRVKPEWRLTVMRNLISHCGRKWLQAHAYGVAARQISKSDLLRFPIDLKE